MTNKEILEAAANILSLNEYPTPELDADVTKAVQTIMCAKYA